MEIEPPLRLYQCYNPCRSYSELGASSARRCPIRTYLLEFVGNHCKSLENGVCWSSDGDDPLWTVAFRNIDSGSALGKKIIVM